MFTIRLVAAIVFSSKSAYPSVSGPFFFRETNLNGHPFFEKILEELYQQNIQSEDQNQLVLHSTGPFMLNRVLDKHPTPDVVLIDSKFVSPLSYLEAETFVKDNFVGMSRQLASAYCIHLHWGSWWKS